MILPSIEEGFGLVCVEAMGSGCVPLVSDVCTELCRHGENALVHSVGDVETLTRHLTLLHERPSELDAPPAAARSSPRRAQRGTQRVSRSSARTGAPCLPVRNYTVSGRVVSLESRSAEDDARSRGRLVSHNEAGGLGPVSTSSWRMGNREAG